jgi:hypothetical protein
MSEALLFSNDAFYTAFATRDVSAMEALWDRDAPSTCLHPGWGPIFGYEDILESWRELMRNTSAPRIECRAPRAQIYGDVGNVICFEALPGGYMAAANTFVRRGAVWKIVHHQAGPTGEKPPIADLAETMALN